tara:strand:+ start:2316 stop:3107 length:792 start_codon:yes stop_codon:yes gene_type:complete
MKKYLFKGYGKEVELDEIANPLKLKKKISIVIPSFNEGENIEKLAKEIVEVLGKTDFGKSFEIIVVDDDSKDKTPEIINRLSDEDNFIALHRYQDKGIFPAVMDGIRISNGEYVLVMDADFSHPPELIPEFIKYGKTYDIVCGSRFVKGGSNNEPIIRKIGTYILNKACSIILGVDQTDLGGQFRLFDKKKFLDIDLKYESKFAEYGMEVLYKAKEKNYKVKEIPFVYEFREGGESKMGNLMQIIPLGFHYLGRSIRIRFGKN